MKMMEILLHNIIVLIEDRFYLKMLKINSQNNNHDLIYKEDQQQFIVGFLI